MSGAWQSTTTGRLGWGLISRERGAGAATLEQGAADVASLTWRLWDRRSSAAGGMLAQHRHPECAGMMHKLAGLAGMRSGWSQWCWSHSAVIGVLDGV